MVLNSKFEIPNVRELLKSLKNARSVWKLKTPMQKWCYLYSIGRAIYGLIRIPILNDVNQVHWFGYFMFTYLSIIPLLSLYSIRYYAYQGDLQLALPSTCCAFVCFGHLPMAMIIISEKRFKLQSLIDFGGRYIYHDNHEKTEYNRICSNHMDITMRQYIKKMAAIMTSLVFSLAGPAYAYFIHGIFTTTIEARIPFTEPNSNAELIVNVLLQTMLGFHGCMIYLGLESFPPMLENVITITPRLIKMEFKHTIQLWETKSISELELNLNIGNIVKQSNDADNYVASLSKLLYWRNLCSSVAFTYLTGMCIFCQYTMGYVAGYGLACMSFLHVFYICELGENIQDNGFAKMLYQTKWEVLPMNIQKAIMLLIHRKQNEKGLSLARLVLASIVKLTNCRPIRSTRS